MTNLKLSAYLVRHQILVKAIVVGGLSVVILLAGLLPLIGNTSTTLKKITVKEKEAKALSDKVAVLSQLDQNVLKERLSTLDSALLPRKDVVAYLSAVDGLARELGLTFNGLSLAPGDVTDEDGLSPGAKANTPVQTLDTTLKINGSEESIYAFLRSVEQMLPLMQVKDVKMSRVNDTQYSLSLVLGMLWAPPVSGDVKGPVKLFTEKEEAYFQLLASYRRFNNIVAPGDTVPSTGGKADLFAQ